MFDVHSFIVRVRVGHIRDYVKLLGRLLLYSEDFLSHVTPKNHQEEGFEAASSNCYCA